MTETQRQEAPTQNARGSGLVRRRARTPQVLTVRIEPPVTTEQALALIDRIAPQMVRLVAGFDRETAAKRAAQKVQEEQTDEAA
jgi:hypothetical protein